MTSGIDFDETAITSLRLHYEAIAYTNLRELWKRRWLIVSIVLSVAALASVVLVMMGLRYTGEALIQLDFNREEAPVGARSQPIASLDAASLVDSAARIIRSRATASAVVARIGLDKGPLSASQWPARVLASAWAALGVEPATLSAHDLATNELMSKIEVRNEPRSYLISVKVTSKDPDQAATLANAVALERRKVHEVADGANKGVVH